MLSCKRYDLEGFAGYAHYLRESHSFLAKESNNITFVLKIHSILQRQGIEVPPEDKVCVMMVREEGEERKEGVEEGEGEGKEGGGRGRMEGEGKERGRREGGRERGGSEEEGRGEKGGWRGGQEGEGEGDRRRREGEGGQEKEGRGEGSDRSFFTRRSWGES
jgi:hypothetical protein